MTQAEQILVQSFNTYFAEENVAAIAYRRKQAHYTGQVCDVLVDSPHPQFYLAIESKSIHLRSTPKLYFTQHFHTRERNQLDGMDMFLQHSGRYGYVAIEVRYGKGHPNALYMVPWSVIMERYSSCAGIAPEDIDEYYIPKQQGYYAIRQLF